MPRRVELSCPHCGAAFTRLSYWPPWWDAPVVRFCGRCGAVLDDRSVKRPAPRRPG